MKPILFIITILTSFSLQSQTDFPAMKQQFLDYRRADNQDSALYIARKMNQLALKEQSDTSYWYALSMRYQGNPHYTWGNTDSTIFYWKKSVELFEEYHSSNRDLISSLNNIGNIYLNQAMYKLAESNFKKAVENFYKIDSSNLSEISQILGNLGNLYSEIGNYESAIKHYNLALDIEVASNNTVSLEHGVTCLNLAMSNTDVGNYQISENYLRKASKIFKNLLGTQNAYYSYTMNAMGVLNWKLGNYPLALMFYKKAAVINEMLFGINSIDLAYNLFNIGEVYIDLGEIDSTEVYFRKASRIFKKELKIGHPFFAHLNNGFGKFYKSAQKYDKALIFYKKALQTDLSTLNKHPDLADSYRHLGFFYYLKSDYPESEKFMIKAMNIYRAIYGENHENYILTANNYADLLSRTNRKKQAYEILNNNFTKKSKQIAENFEWLNDNQKEVYWQKETGFYDNLSWFASKACTKVPEAVALNYNGALITKSKLLETKISKENYYIEVDEIREELSYRKKLLNKLESDGSDKRELMDKLRNEADSLDKQLELSWPAYAEQKRNLLITWDKVHQNLSDGEAAIEFVRFREDEDSAYQYQSLIIRKDLKLPVLAPLCFEKDLLAINPKSGFSAYYPLVWEPMEQHLKDIHTIYYAPSGELYNVPFHAIYAPKGSGDQKIAAKQNKRGEILTDPETESEEDAAFLMDRYTLHQLTSTRYLALGLKKKEQEQPEASIAMVGGVNYDYLPGDENTKAKKSKKSKKSKNRSSTSASGKLAYLEGTKKETESINSTVETKSWETTYLEGNNAKEEYITKLTDKEAKGILHIATHGYAFPEYSSSDTTIKENSLRYSYRFSQNPMVRSGLILAGGNWAWTGSDTLETLGAEENGILTALEVSGLNLRKTKLVVLSACETGLGKIEGSEGTFGLKRGFKLAGVEQIIVSLWSVPDKETMELMTLFYEDLTESLNPVISFEKAQKQMRETYPTRPDLWAGFVLVR